MSTLSDINLDALESRLKGLRDMIGGMAADLRRQSRHWDFTRSRRASTITDPAVLVAITAGIGVVAGLAFLALNNPYRRRRRPYF